MYLGGNWEFFYASALIEFAGAKKDQRHSAAKMLLSTFESDHSFNEAELTAAHTRAQRGVGIIRKWDKLPAARRASWIKALNSIPRSIPAVMYFKLDPRKGLQTTSAPDSRNSLTLHNAVDLGLALFSSDESPWRKRLARCPLAGCGVLFIKGGFGKGKPKGTCSEEHRRELHLQQMREANKRQS